MAVPEALPRHALLRLAPDADWRALDPAASGRLRAWLAAGFPAVLARCQGDEPSGWLRLGVPLPPAEGKRRLTLLTPRAAIADWRPPLSLRAALPTAPKAWTPALARMRALAEALGLEPAVFGAFAWQALTGLEYVHAGSDLDLAWRPRAREELWALLVALPEWEAATGRRTDGELLLPDGAGVCWRELASGAARVLVKAPAAVELRSRREVLAAFEH